MLRFAVESHPSLGRLECQIANISYTQCSIVDRARKFYVSGPSETRNAIDPPPPFLLILTQIVLGVLSKDHSSYIFRPSEGPQYVCTAQSSQVGGRPFPRRRSSFGRYTSWRLPELYAGSRGTRKLVHCSAAKVEGVSPCSQAVLERRQPSIDSVPLHTSLNTQVSTHCVRRLRLARRQPSPSLCMLLLQQALKKRPVIVYHVCWEAHSLIHTHTAATRGLAAHMLST